MASSIRIFGVNIQNMNRETLMDRLLSVLDDPKGGASVACYVNVHGLNLAYDDQEFREVLNASDLVYADGMGLKIVNNLLSRHKLESAMTPPSWMHDFFGKMRKGSRVYLIGDEEAVIRRYFTAVSAEFPHLDFAGYCDGYFLRDKREQELLDTLQKVKPDVVLVGMGMPLQEKWIQRVRSLTPVKLWLPVGAYYRWMIEDQKRPPAFVTNLGFEWLYRLMLEPKRLFKRYVVGNPLFILRLLTSRK
jgi:N-acetylglucosaminyldiphosphoundecaprenol N-acetyl-beta-D-mannosaminyltransferase